MLEGFLAKFDALVGVLTAHPHVRVTHVWRGPPATDAMLAEVAQAWGHPVPAEVATLYRQANGAKLRWADIGDERYDAARDGVRRVDGPWQRFFDSPGAHTGYLDIPTLDELMGRDTVGAMFDGDHEEYLARAIPFDSFGESQDAVLFFGDGAPDPWISVASDYLADVPPPGERTLSQYLDHVFATWASTAHRTKEGPRILDRMLRQRVELDASRLVGQRVVYRDERRGGSLMHGLVVSRTDLREIPRDWAFGPTLVEVHDDLGETVSVPLRALFPPDGADDYEPLRADARALRALLSGHAEPLFDALASVALMTHREGLSGGPTLCNHAWPHAALSSSLPASEAAQALIVAAQTLFEHPDTRTERPVAWPVTRPPHGQQRPPSLCMHTLAVGLLDAAVIHIGRAAPAHLASWLGADVAGRLTRILRGVQAQNPLRGYDPLTDPSATSGFLFRALQGGPTRLDVGDPPRHGSPLAGAAHRVVLGT
jgi:hypothetical protein